MAWDSHESIFSILKENWDWTSAENIFVLPAPESDYIEHRITKDSAPPTPLSHVSSVRWASMHATGVGGIPYLGRLTAEYSLLAQEDANPREHFDLRELIRDNIQGKLRGSGTLVTCNSLVGGTGAGFSPIITRFMRDNCGLQSSMTLNISILPGRAEAIGEQYARTVLWSLHTLLTDEDSQGHIVDSVMLVDNDIMFSRTAESRAGFKPVNEAIRDALMPILLAPMSQYAVPQLMPTLDETDIKTHIRPGQGFGPPSFSTLGYAVAPLKSFKSGRLSSSRSHERKVREALESLVDETVGNFTVGGQDEVRAGSGSVGVLFGPPEFFHDYLDMNGDYIHNLTACMAAKLGHHDLPKLACMSFDTDGLDFVGLSILTSGSGSSRVEGIFHDALGESNFDRLWDSRTDPSENIRNLPAEVVEDLALDDLRRAFSA